MQLNTPGKYYALSTYHELVYQIHSEFLGKSDVVQDIWRLMRGLDEWAMAW